MDKNLYVYINDKYEGVLNSEDVATFEYETKLKVFATIPPVDDRQENIEPINKFIEKMIL